MSAVNDARVQLAVYSGLTQDAGLIAALPLGAESITAFPVPGLVMPYVVVAATTGAPQDTQTYAGRDTRITVEVYSRAPGGSEARELLEKAAAAFVNSELALPGQVVVLRQVLDSRCVRESDGQTYYGTLSLRIVSDSEGE